MRLVATVSTYPGTVETYDKKLCFGALESGFFLFPAGYIYSFGRGIRFSGQKCSIPASGGQQIGKTKPENLKIWGSQFLILWFLIICLHRNPFWAPRISFGWPYVGSLTVWMLPGSVYWPLEGNRALFRKTHMENPIWILKAKIQGEPPLPGPCTLP